MAVHTLEGKVHVTEAETGYYEVLVGGEDVAQWANKVAPMNLGERPQVKAVLMIEDAVYLEAQGKLSARGGEYGYSSWTPGSGPMVDVWNVADSYAAITDALETHDGCVVALSLEVID